MPSSDKLSIVTDALEAHLTAGKDLLGIKDIFWDEDLIPKTPAISLEPDTKSRDLQETGHMTVNTFRIYLTVWHSRLTDPSVSRKETLILAEQIEDYIHTDRTLGGVVIHSYVSTVTAGVATRQKVFMRATRLQWTALSKTRL